MRKFLTIQNAKLVSTESAGEIEVYVNPTDAERRFLVETMKIDEHTLSSALDPNELARIEAEEDHLAVIVKRPKRYTAADNFLFKVESFGLFLFQNKLIILLSEEATIFDGKQFARVNSLPEILLKLMYRATFHFQEHIRAISMCSDELEQAINKSSSNKQLIDMFSLEKSLVFYLNAINANGRVIDKLRSNVVKKGTFNEDQLEFIEDLSIENAQCYKTAEIYWQVVGSLMDARASIINNNLNLMMKRMNAIVISVAVPSFFAGVGGMSELPSWFRFMPPMYAYIIFLAAMLLVGIVTYRVIQNNERF
jgi:magnesium transporter